MSNIGFILCITPLRQSQLFLMWRASQSVQIVVAMYPHQILICKQGVQETLDMFLITLCVCGFPDALDPCLRVSHFHGHPRAMCINDYSHPDCPPATSSPPPSGATSTVGLPPPHSVPPLVNGSEDPARHNHSVSA
ncbi:uncharacterized protein LACBIDRAFT_333202 [Laccaria bicolor S238N-H82]|uniref:Predicted protein n=1 Tax=Laccaria bicolor (strain S238N-H82 / ATCC MYA-4686) TaxID=486041 RepID=B0DV79_LACBS|nr:uncharacterized protein LACBIDRAFT_333202 [Laccaria bicolor S238N-H82]EDR01464.1 predicted protein [Laccaria bicolor S238N-H82]|eukprot:XP_001887816.1 predicted protein [Laccaria bicolor S238N-H82]